MARQRDKTVVLSAVRREQIAYARHRAIYSRRLKQKARLEKQLAEVSEWIRLFEKGAREEKERDEGVVPYEEGPAVVDTPTDEKALHTVRHIFCTDS